MSDNIISSRPERDQSNKGENLRGPRTRVIRWIGIIFILAALLTLYYGAIAFVGWRSGESIRQTEIEENRISLISRQKELAILDINQNRYQMAMRRLDYVLAVDPNDQEAATLRNDASTRLAVLLTPSPSVTPTATSTPTITPSPTIPPPTADATAAFDLIVEEYDTLRDQLRANPTAYQENINQLEAFRSRHSSYERREIDRLLYENYIAYGQILTRSTEIEQGLTLLYQAKKLGDLPEEIEGEIFWAEQYLEGIIYYGIRWDTYLSYFRPLCQFAPLYQDSCTKLQIGLINSANIALESSDWCLAESLYDEATSVGTFVEGFNSEIESVRELCALVTPEAGTGTPGVVPDTINGTPIPPGQRSGPVLFQTPTATLISD